MALALAGAAWLGFAGANSLIWSGAASYIMFSFVTLSDFRHKSEWRFWLECVTDVGYFAFWTRLAPETLMPAACLSYSLASAVLQRGVMETTIAAAAAAAISPSVAAPPAALALAAASYQRYLHRRISASLGRRLALRPQAQNAREAERERIAADFHDGPLQHFVGFQMRLEIVKKLLARGDVEAAVEEVRQLQELGRAQVADLRRFARGMRPIDDALPPQESLERMVAAFQRDTRIPASFSACDLAAEPSAAQELLQMVGEALHNVAKHSRATRVIVSAAQDERGLEVAIEDNGSGFAFSGSFNLDELDRLHAGPISIKRRVRLLNGELRIDSEPGQGAKLKIRVPV